MVQRCAVNDSECSPGRLKTGYCEKHYQRLRKHGTTSDPRIDIFSHYKIDPETGCWRWKGAKYRNGYGKLPRPTHGTRLAHRAFYIEFRNPIPDGMDLDHVHKRGCRYRDCVRPKHLEPASRATNLQRGHAARTMCEAGLHAITVPGAVKPGTRQCVECWRIRYRAASKRYRAKQRLTG